MNLASGQLDVYRNQLLELHRLVGIQAGLTGSDPLAKQEEEALSDAYKRRQAEEAEKRAVSNTGPKPFELSLLEQLDEDGGLREHDCVRPFILVLISAVAEGTAEDQALGLIALQRTLSKRRPLVERFVRWGGLKVLWHMIERCEGEGETELMDLVLETLRTLPVVIEAVKSSRLPKLMKRLVDSSSSNGDAAMDVDGGGHATTRVKVLAQKLLDLWSSAVKKAAAAVPATPVPSSSSSSAVKTKTPPTGAEPSSSRPVKRAKKADEQEGGAAGEEAPRPEPDGAKETVQHAPRKDGALIRLGVPAPLKRVTPSAAVAGLSPAAERGPASSGAAVEAPPPDEPAAPEDLPQLPSFTTFEEAQQKKRRVRWADTDGGGDLVAVRLFEREEDDGASSSKKKKASVKEMAKKEHLSERAHHKKDKKLPPELPPEKRIEVRRQGWKKPRRMKVKPPEGWELNSTEKRVQAARVRNLFEVSYVREDDIPSTPNESRDGVYEPAPNAPTDVPLVVIPFEPPPEEPPAPAPAPPPAPVLPPPPTSRVTYSPPQLPLPTPPRAPPPLPNLGGLNPAEMLRNLLTPGGPLAGGLPPRPPPPTHLHHPPPAPHMHHPQPQPPGGLPALDASQLSQLLSVLNQLPKPPPGAQQPAPAAVLGVLSGLMPPAPSAAAPAPLLGPSPYPAQPPHPTPSSSAGRGPDRLGLLPPNAMAQGGGGRAPSGHHYGPSSYQDQQQRPPPSDNRGGAPRREGRRHCAFFNANRRNCRNDPCPFIHDQNFVPGEEDFPARRGERDRDTRERDRDRDRDRDGGRRDRDDYRSR